MTSNALTLPTVPLDEAAPFYHGYLAQLSDGRVGFHLHAQVAQLDRLCAGLDDERATFRYAAGKWSIKEVIGHLLDAERIFAYRLLRISRNDASPLAGFDETRYVPEGRFDDRRLADLLDEFRLQRASTLALANGIPAGAWTRTGSANGFPVSARALACIIVGHTAHHLGLLRDRYRLPHPSA
ncbi:MAG TPA: DinB family protein [Vicinamibacterales bacterium]|nr:DinB family protein [Vicinamibacterales bacterium]